MRQIGLMVLLILGALAGSISATIVLATEPVAPTSETAPVTVPTVPPSPSPAPLSAPLPPKPQVHESDTKHPAKAPIPGAPIEGAGKEVSPAKPEPGVGTAPVPPKPRAPEGDAKPPVKSQHPANGSGASKSASAPQPPAELTGKDGAPMVLVPAGEFTMGSDKGDDDEQPIHRVFLVSFYIDKFEVTNTRFAKFVEAIQSEPPWGFADKETPVVHPDRPVRWVNWMDAMGYCLWAGKRLPTEAEWEKAARGTDERVYPWGNDPPTTAHAVFGLKEGVDTVSPVGNRDKGRSPYGVHDMAGNLYEWTMDWYDEKFYSKIPAINPRGPAEGTVKVQRGGSYTNTPYRLRSTFRTKGDPTEHEFNVGFRCAQDLPNLP
ncbi:MAG: SUMF1/EgtB/PvdO family nonheme iron enzyme [Nitrospirota bacterium]|nr:SUMF1/EgtB/PvdO family nonheme iron enzyme [Nitrospirota bacterium]MDP2384373.1 SUMF1/EgtB/PvdO family nonheme iron enzyme [Nitrospirota bacterium]